jgi:hypothetical protein
MKDRGAAELASSLKRGVEGQLVKLMADLTAVAIGARWDC